MVVSATSSGNAAMAADALVQSLGMASQAWVSFDLQKKRSSLEKTAATAKEQKEQSLAARKQLADTTKQFKRSVKAMEQAQLKKSRQQNKLL